MINAIKFYRIANWLYRKKIPLLPHIVTLLIFLLYNSKISHKTVIGKGTLCAYGGIGVLIHSATVIGNDCSIGAGVKIVGRTPYINVPKIGNKVYMGPGCVVSGPVIIEDNVIIAANAVVTKSIPAGAVVGGIPAKIMTTIKELDYDITKSKAFKNGYIDFLSDTRKEETSL